MRRKDGQAPLSDLKMSHEKDQRQTAKQPIFQTIQTADFGNYLLHG